MAIRTVRLDEETEKILAQIVTLTGLSVSAAVKKGLRALADDVVGEARRVPSSTRPSTSGPEDMRSPRRPRYVAG